MSFNLFTAEDTSNFMDDEKERTDVYYVFTFFLLLLVLIRYFFLLVPPKISQPFLPLEVFYALYFLMELGMLNFTIFILTSSDFIDMEDKYQIRYVLSILLVLFFICTFNMYYLTLRLNHNTKLIGIFVWFLFAVVSSIRGLTLNHFKNDEFINSNSVWYTIAVALSVIFGVSILLLIQDIASYSLI